MQVLPDCWKFTVKYSRVYFCINSTISQTVYVYLNCYIGTLVTQITYAVPPCAHLCHTRPLNITFLLLVLNSLYLMGFESSFINFTCPHFCPQLFIGPYYENLNLLFDYWLSALEACGFWCIIEQSLSHKWLLHTGIKVWVFWMSSHPAEESFLQILSMCNILQESDHIPADVQY